MPSARTLPVLPILAALAAGCGDDATTTTYVGKVTDPGADAVVGMVSDGERVELYLCGGPSTYTTLTRWFHGPLSRDGTFSIESGGFVAKGDVSTLAGEIATDDGQRLSFSLGPAPSELGGVYSAMDGACRTGAVVGDFDGDGVVDLQGTWCNGEDVFAQVTPILPMTVTERGIRVDVDLVPPKELWVDRVRLP